MAERHPGHQRWSPPKPPDRRSRPTRIHARPAAYASYRDAVSGLMQAGEPFEEDEEAIDASRLNDEVTAALWLLAFSMREPRRRPRA